MVHFKTLCVLIALGLGAKPTTSLNSSLPSPPKLEHEVEDNSRYKTLEANATLMKLLVDKKDGVSRAEVFDMLHSRDNDEDHMDLPIFPEDDEDAAFGVLAEPDSQAEVIQGKRPLDLVQMEQQSTAGRVPMGLAAGIMILLTVSTVCIAYTSLIVWRRIYLKRNGLKHHLLRNEDQIAETRIEL